MSDKQKNTIISAEQVVDSAKRFKEELQTLITESETVSGREASAIKASTVELQNKISNSKLTSKAQKKLLDKLKKLQDDVDSEDKLEKTCGKVVQIGLLFTSVVPLILTLLGTMTEYATRPTLITNLVDLTSHRVVIVGGCGAVGSELGTMFATSGASVVLGCREVDSWESVSVEDEFGEDVIESKTNQMKLRASDRQTLHEKLEKQGILSESGAMNPGKVSIWPLDLESFSSVSGFANKYMDQEGSLDILVHTAATKEGCVITEDGFELSHQVNFLAPALLTQMLLPALGVDIGNKISPHHADFSTRIVHTTCDAAMQLPDWLPWPMRRIDPNMLPQVDMGRLIQKKNTVDIVLPHCSSLTEYANAKLGNAVHTKELARRLSSRTLVSTHIVNPGSMDTRFGLTAGPVTTRVSARAQMMSYLPPVWLGKKLWALLSSKMNFSRMLLRQAKEGAQLIYHVCTSDALSDMTHPGGFFSDTAGVNVDCGKEAWQCSRLVSALLPDAVLNKSLGIDLWRSTDMVIRNHLGEPVEIEKKDITAKKQPTPVLSKAKHSNAEVGSDGSIKKVVKVEAEVEAEWD